MGGYSVGPGKSYRGRRFGYEKSLGVIIWVIFVECLRLESRLDWGRGGFGCIGRNQGRGEVRA